MRRCSPSSFPCFATHLEDPGLLRRRELLALLAPRGGGLLGAQRAGQDVAEAPLVALRLVRRVDQVAHEENRLFLHLQLALQAGVLLHLLRAHQLDDLALAVFLLLVDVRVHLRG
jgi:hypothetical protein